MLDYTKASLINRKSIFNILILLFTTFFNIGICNEEIHTKNGTVYFYTKNELLQAIKTINKEELNDEDKQKKLDEIDNLTKLNEKLTALEEQYREFETIKNNQKKLITSYQDKLAQSTKQYNIQEYDFSKYSSSKLKEKLNELTLQQQKVQTQLDSANNSFLSAQSFPSRAPKLIVSNNESINKLSEKLTKEHLEGYAYDAVALEIYILEKENSYLQEKLISQSVFEDLENYKVQILTKENEYLLDYIRQIQNYQNEHIASDLVGDDGIDIKNLSPEILDEIKKNEQYAKYVENRQKENLKIAKEQRDVVEALTTVKQIQSNVIRQLHELQGSLILSRLLNRQQTEIPEISISYNLDELIPDLSIWIYDLRHYRDQMFDVKQYVDNMIVKDPNLAPYEKELELIIAKRKDLFDQLYSGLSTTLTQSIDLKDKYDSYTEIKQNLENTINEQLFWLASNQSIGIDFIVNFYPMIVAQLNNFLRNLSTLSYWSNTISTLTIILGICCALGLIIKLLSKQLIKFDDKLARRLDKASDRFWVTPLAFINRFVLIIPKVSWIIAIGAFIVYMTLDNSAHQIEVTLMVALHVTIFIFYLDLLKPNSIVQRHFAYSPVKLERQRSTIDKLYLAVIPILVVANLREIDSADINTDIIGYCTIFIFAIILNIITFNFVKDKFANNDLSLLSGFLSLFYILIPFALVILLAFGYYYTAIKLINRIAFTYYICLAYIIISNMIRRILYLAEVKMVRRTKFSKIKHKISAFNTLRFELINSKAFKLINIILLGITAFFMYLQWQDLAGVFSYLDTVHIYTSSSIVDGKEVISNVISLANIITAIFILLVAVVLNRNLPALLERLFLLKQTVLYKSTSYTVRIITSYIITTLGIIFAAGSLGISWDNLQWLVAALSVGLGFGLQEIFANFVSGIIILFERQIRVGDIITLNGLSGTVNKIRIRAITIVSFDNKEVMIPNREFITSALTNWSLSNTVTMLEFAVGIAYDADVTKAKKILTEIIRKCEYLAPDKSFRVYVKSLDASCVTIMCEVFVKEIGLRKTTYDYISTQTLKLFAKEEIEIPFNQLDVKIKNLDTGKELKVETIRN